MWPQVKKDLCAMLGGQIYPILLTDAVYRQFLKNAGLGPNFQPDNKIPSAKLKQFQESAELRARIVVAEIAKSGGIEPASSSAKLLKRTVDVIPILGIAFARTARRRVVV